MSAHIERTIQPKNADPTRTHLNRELIQFPDGVSNMTEAQLHRAVEDLNDQIERLYADMQKLKDNHARELNRTNEQHQQEVSNLKRILDKAYRWFPSFKRFLNIERECLQYGFNEEQTNKLLHGQNINYSGGFTPMSIGAMHLLIIFQHK